MNTQLNQNTELSNLLLRDVVGPLEVCMFLDEVWEQHRGIKANTHRNTNDLTNPYLSIQRKLMLHDELEVSEKLLLLEVLENANRLFRTYGKRSRGLEKYIKNLKEGTIKKI